MQITTRLIARAAALVAGPAAAIVYVKVCFDTFDRSLFNAPGAFVAGSVLGIALLAGIAATSVALRKRQ